MKGPQADISQHPYLASWRFFIAGITRLGTPEIKVG
jgi:hypothetical protein